MHTSRIPAAERTHSPGKPLIIRGNGSHAEFSARGAARPTTLAPYWIVTNRVGRRIPKERSASMGIGIDRASLNARGVRAHRTNNWHIHVGIKRIASDVGQIRVAETWKFFSVHIDRIIVLGANHLACPTPRTSVKIDYDTGELCRIEVSGFPLG